MSDKVGQLVRRFGEFKSQKGGAELVFRCPDCEKWKLSYNAKKNVFHACWSCNFTVRAGRAVKRFIRSFEPGKKAAEDRPIESIEERFPLAGRKVEGFLEKRGVDINWAMDNHWGMTKTGRLFIPIVENGLLMSWVARSVDDQFPKELSGPNRSHFFYGYRHSMDCSSITLVEGIFDQFKIETFGMRCLALMGSSISDVQIGKLIILKPTQIILMLDGDEAGRKATETIAKKLGQRMNPMRIHKVYIPEGMDPDDLTKEQFDKLMEEI